MVVNADGELNADISNNYVNFQRARTDDILSEGYTGTLTRSDGVVTMTLPATPAHNYLVGDIIYITPGETNFPAGNKPVTAVTATTLTYAEPGLNGSSGPQTAAVSSYDHSAFNVEGDPGERLFEHHRLVLGRGLYSPRRASNDWRFTRTDAVLLGTAQSEYSTDILFKSRAAPWRS